MYFKHYEREREKQLKCCSSLDYLYELMRNIDFYTSNGYLNSEGVKLLNNALRLIVEYCPEYSQIARRARKTLVLEYVEKLVGLIHDYCDQTSDLSDLE